MIMGLLPVSDALSTVLNAVTELKTEIVTLGEALGRVASADITARLTQPPFAASAMDGYAVRFDDIAGPLRVVGESQAGRSYDGILREGEAVRIFTGAPMVSGADTVIIQENVSRNGDLIVISDCKEKGSNIRAAGGDFKFDDVLIQTGTKLDARHIALLAAGNVADISVYKKPRVAILATGDELLEVGSKIGADKIVNSNVPMFMALIEENGGIPVNLGIARDTAQSIKDKIAMLKDVDIFVSIGGVSVGDYDIIQDILKQAGLKVSFWKVAMQPGKPLVFGDFNGIHYFGMPGNPSSSYVCFINFLLPAMSKMMGLGPCGLKENLAKLEHELKAGGSRVNYMRASYSENEKGEKSVTARLPQSSANLSPLANSNCLLVREIDAPPAKKGDFVKIILIE